MDNLNEFLSDMFDYYKQDASGGAARIYKRALKSIPIEQLYEMLDTHIADPDKGQFMPKVADFVRVSSGTKKGNATAAWNKIYTAISTIGPYATFTIDDPWAMRALSEIGGFQSLCEMTVNDLDFKMHEFNRLYEMYRGQGAPENYPSKFKGLVELENGAAEEVMLIGEPERAKRVLNAGKESTGLQVTALSHVLDKVKKLD
jgi:hypothetical protein